MIDFVGQSSPVPRWKFLALDVLCVTLQALLFGIALEREKDGTNVASQHVSIRSGPDPDQNHDAEEAGLPRSSLGTVEQIEMEDFGTNHQASAQTDEEVGQMRVCGGTARSNVQDLLYTGRSTIAELHIRNSVQEQWQLRNVSSGATTTSEVQVAAAAAGRRLTRAVARVRTVQSR